MAVRIRLTRVGATKRPSYRVVAIDSRRPRDGRALEILGFYDPLTDPATVQLDTEKLNAWIGKGARPSDTVVKLMRQASIPVPAGYEPDRSTPAARTAPKPPKRAKTKAAAEPATEETAPADVAEEPAAEEAVANGAASEPEPVAAEPGAAEAEPAADEAKA